MFGIFESSRSKGQPAELYQFVYGDTPTAYHAYTDAQEQIIFNGISFQPVPLKRSGITANGTLDKATLTISMPANLDVPELFRIYPPSQPVQLTVWQGHSSDPAGDYATLWVGRTLSCAFDGNQANVSCQTVSTSMKRPGLRRNWQYACPHVLYGPQCRANKIAATIAVTVQSFDSSRITLPSDWATTEMAPKYAGGMVSWQQPDGRTETRTILRVESGRILFLSGLTKGVFEGVTVNVTLGCNHQSGLTDDCIALHNNIANYGGQPWIPLKNPIGIVNNYY